LTRKFENPVFVKNLGLMMDSIKELSDISLALQKSDITLPTANKLVSKQIEVFTARKECNSEYYSKACRAVECGVFRVITLSASSGWLPEIQKAQFYQALPDSMAVRLLPESEKCFSMALESVNPCCL
jgi:hypothetical protein